MLKEPTQTLDGPALSEQVYHLALEQIKALLGCTGDSPEERELIDWATIADVQQRQRARGAGSSACRPATHAGSLGA